MKLTNWFPVTLVLSALLSGSASADTLELRDGRAGACGGVQTLLQERLTAVTGELQELARVQGVLQAALDWCHRSADDARCVVLDDLDAQASD